MYWRKGVEILIATNSHHRNTLLNLWVHIRQTLPYTGYTFQAPSYLFQNPVHILPNLIAFHDDVRSCEKLLHNRGWHFFPVFFSYLAFITHIRCGMEKTKIGKHFPALFVAAVKGSTSRKTQRPRKHLNLNSPGARLGRSASSFGILSGPEFKATEFTHLHIGDDLLIPNGDILREIIIITSRTAYILLPVWRPQFSPPVRVVVQEKRKGEATGSVFLLGKIEKHGLFLRCVLPLEATSLLRSI